MHQVLEFIANFDSRLDTLAEAMGHWTYVVVFLTIYAETGLVVMPFLPGDSLLFAVGVLSARPDTGLHLPVFLSSLWVASVLGNYTNFLIGRALSVKLGGQPGIEAAGQGIRRLFGGKFARFVRPQDLVRAEEFFRKYGLFAVAIARFLPFFRTLVPFVAGISDMKVFPFLMCSVVGGAAWVLVCTMVGYWAGNIPWVKENFTWFILTMFAIGFLPIIVGYLRKRASAARQTPAATGEGGAS
ncbi:MAG: VTT domain-containing protein [Phycisphaerae bacterium]|jgi:membrane-associated protein